MATYHVLVYRLGTKLFAVKRNSVVAIHPLTQSVSTEIDDLSRNIVGVIITGKMNVPVFSIHEKLGLPAFKKTVNTKVIVIKVGQNLFGIIADQIPGIVKSSVTKPGSGHDLLISEEFIRAWASDGNQALPILEWLEIFDPKAATEAVNS